MVIKKANVTSYGSILMLIVLYTFFTCFLQIMPWIVFGTPIFLFLYSILLVVKFFDFYTKESSKLPATSYYFILIEPMIFTTLIVITYVIDPRLLSDSIPFKYNLDSIITVCILVPVVEELLFRGLLLEEQLQDQSKRKAIIINAIFFFLIHLKMDIILFISSS